MRIRQTAPWLAWGHRVCYPCPHDSSIQRHYGLVEIKLGGAELIGKGVATLEKLATKIDTGRQRPPAFKMVLTAVGDFAYRRPEDGVIVCPISALKQ